jgi:hypothetical protein
MMLSDERDRDDLHERVDGFVQGEIDQPIDEQPCCVHQNENGQQLALLFGSAAFRVDPQPIPHEVIASREDKRNCDAAPFLEFQKVGEKVQHKKVNDKPAQTDSGELAESFDLLLVFTGHAVNFCASHD